MQDSSRRLFVKNTLKASVVAGLGMPLALHTACAPKREPEEDNQEKVAGLVINQNPLPYQFHELEPYIDAQTMEIHYSKHHAAYVKNMNEALLEEGGSYSNVRALLAEISKASMKLRNNAGGAWNHDFFWEMMKPGGSEVPGKLREALEASFGDLPTFQKLFTEAAMGRFGSGWAWLIQTDQGLRITSTPNQDNPLMDVAEISGTPLLGLDVWEHAYYLKYQNQRAAYIENWWNVVNFEKIAQKLV
jgi:superoxide dismutase, Fe-Mn family